MLRNKLFHNDIYSKNDGIHSSRERSLKFPNYTDFDAFISNLYSFNTEHKNALKSLLLIQEKKLTREPC